MDDLSFLNQTWQLVYSGGYDSSNATLKIVLPNGQVDHISDCISTYQLLDRCPLLYHTFEYGYQSRLQASIEAPSRSAVIALLRFCYTNSYLPPGAEDAPISFLLHAQVYKMAEQFDIPELQLVAHGNFSCQVDFACSLPYPPHDLLETIRYVYIYFADPVSRQHQSLVQTLLNYCISVFQYHRLGESAEFLEVVQQVPEFRQDLCRTNMDRNFSDDCALDIIQLALDTLQTQPSIRPTTLASRDLPEEMLFDRPARPAVPANAIGCTFDVDAFIQSPTIKNNSDGPSNMGDSPMPILNPSALAFRPKYLQPAASTGFETESSSEDEGFSMMHPPKSHPLFTQEDPVSSSTAAGAQSPGKLTFEDYQMQLMLLEQQSKKRLLETRAEQAKQEALISSSAAAGAQGPGKHALEDYQMQLMLLEQQNKKRLLMARAEQDKQEDLVSPSAAAGAQSPVAYNPQDDEMQLDLLEQQNMKRPFFARHVQDSMYSQNILPSPEPTSNPEIMCFTNPDIMSYSEMNQTMPSKEGLQDYQMQLMLLEQQNKKRLLMARAEQDKMHSQNVLPIAETTPDPEIMPSSDIMSDSEPMSSPEIIPSNPETQTVDILALTGSNYADDDDDWTML